MSKKNVLIITRDFPPNCDKVGWMIRMKELSEFLSQNDVVVHVLCIQKSKTWFEDTIPQNVVLHSVSHPILSYNYEKKYVKTLRDYFSKLVLKIYQKLFLKIDVFELVLKRFKKQSFEIIKKHNIQNVIISSPPHSLQTLVLCLKEKFSEVNVISDFRDPWSLRKNFLFSKTKKNLNVKKIEKSIFEKADHLVFVSQGMQEMYAEILQNKDVKVIENGYAEFKKTEHPDPDFLHFIAESRAENRMVLGYFGVGGVEESRTDGKNLWCLIEAFLNHPELAKKFALVLQGDIAIKKELPKDLKVYIGKSLQNAVVRANMQNIDVGILLYTDAFDAPLVMGGKLYDYAASEIALWLIVPSNATSLFRFAKKTGNKAYFSDVEKEKEIVDCLETIIEEKNNDAFLKRRFLLQDVFEYSRHQQNKKFLEILK